ncbi:MAG: DUF4254 domain-containing protein [Bacteroidales bacterium]|jgi:hypothetical protein|nr:DUF4254 domain-containing protein [Bacteroidales bacterium]MDD2263338.1 DUF4254 domain-containing protein [Bacteroidales bacterium]MDD2830872.1 DUF4254 domain-containing protein [Bacteroidales bacterium]MDD3208071.1 DUF4254 domain-containing protein [Bacteroidales bacterium]MDD3696422.1 DUF4254 domain-containing protein [Bacteroidales bacterium]
MDISSFSTHCNSIFDKTIRDYHKQDSVEAVCTNPYPEHSLDNLLYRKNWIDTVQWHLEDIIRDPAIDPADALRIKRRIDASNQERTDLVEQIDILFYREFSGVPRLPGAGLNTETPAWAVDRLSILALKIYHMQIEADRKDSPKASLCREKWEVLIEQRKDLSSAIDQLLADLRLGRKYMKLYKQMKMYNDPLLNPVLYAKGT